MTDRAAIEAELAERLADGDLDGVAAGVVRAYGAELAGFLVGLLRDGDAAADAFSTFCEDLWKSLPRFEPRASFRTWSYLLARHAAYRIAKEPARDRRRHAGLSKLDDLPAKLAEARTTTLPHLRSEVKDRLGDARARLDPDDQVLLILRVDRDLSWRECALVLDGEHDSPAALERRAAALRKRFERIKARLRELLA